MKKICKNCTYWDKYRDGECDRINFDCSDADNDGAEVIATADDDQGLDCYLKTGPNFGCIHFTGK